MQHSFDIDLAVEYGVTEAVLLNNIQYWIEKNKANDTNFFDGYYWTYNSTKALNTLFPYLSQRQIQNALKHLRNEGILQTGNYNKSTYDRTLWYAFTEKGECIMQKCKMDYAEMSNGLCKNVSPIPNNNTDIITNNKDINYITPDGFYDYQKIADLFNSICVSLPKVKILTETRKRAIRTANKQIKGDWEQFFTIVAQSDFLSGKSGKWKASFDWILKPANTVKILEGNYDNKKDNGFMEGLMRYVNE
jgi:hypothetical protein